MTPQEETPQEAAEQHADRSVGNYRYCSDHRGLKWEIAKCHFLSGQQWQHAQDHRALSSALKEIAELHAKLHEMSEYITKVQSNNDDLEFANSELHAKVNQLELVLGDITKEHQQMKFGLQLIIGFDDTSIYSDPGEIAQEYLPKIYQ